MTCDRPIFSAPMVQALIREARRPGTGKTMTRRLPGPAHLTFFADYAAPERRLRLDKLTVPQAFDGVRELRCLDAAKGLWTWFAKAAPHQAPVAETRWIAEVRPRVGDRLWVREAWRPIFDHLSECAGPEDVRFAASVDEVERETSDWRSPIHMPRWASRLTLTVEEVRLERLHAISEGDAKAEGVEFETADPPFYYVPGIHPHSLTAVGLEELGPRKAARSFGRLWNHLHGAGAWEANPWVLAIRFSVALGNIDALGARVGRAVA